MRILHRYRSASGEAPSHAQSPQPRSWTAWRGPFAPATSATDAPPRLEIGPRSFHNHPRRPRLLLRFFFAFAASAAVLLALLLAASLVLTTIAIPDPMALRGNKVERAPVLHIMAADGSLVARRGRSFDYVPFDMLPPHVVDAVLAIEDRRFFSHWGVDPLGLVRASYANLRAGRYVQGGSTLTQQLAKNLFLSSERRISRKLEELYLAFWLELRLSKQDIVELYLNRVYFGGGAYGIEAASQRFFNTSARELSLQQAAVLAGLLKAPSRFSPHSDPASARRRGMVVIRSMREAGFVTKAAARAASLKRVVFTRPGKEQNHLPGFEFAIDYVLESLPPLQKVGAGALLVETTIDPRLQTMAQTSATELLAVHGAEARANQAAVVVLSPSGEILALVGGVNYVQSQFNRAVRARRQPGSAFKPFVYLAALEAGMKPASTVLDVPVSINGYAPRNLSGTFIGETTMREALAHSINSVAVHLHNDNGMRSTREVANRLGVRTEAVDSPSMALGTSAASLLELTGAYGVFANGGFGISPHIVKSIRTETGKLIYQRASASKKSIVDASHAAMMSDMLNAALVHGTGRRAAIPHHPAAGKTGTSQGFRDAWFVGYTGHMIAGVWLGNDNGTPMNRISGGTLPAVLWQRLMRAAHQPLQPMLLPGTAMALSASKPPELPDRSRRTDPIAELMRRVGARQVSRSLDLAKGEAAVTAKKATPRQQQPVPPVAPAKADFIERQLQALQSQEALGSSAAAGVSAAADSNGSSFQGTASTFAPPATFGHYPEGRMSLGVQ